jgi:hypothetical protein
VVDREHVLKAVRSHPPFTQDQAGVVDEHVDTLQPGQPASQSAHLLERGEVGDLRPRPRRAHRAMSAAAASVRRRSRPTSTTVAPSPATAVATAFPIPDVAPVTTQTLPFMPAW